MMKRFLIKISLLSLFVLFTLSIIGFITDYYLLNIKDTQNISSWEHCIYETDEHDVLFIGSSRSYVHFNPIIFDSIMDCNSYNLNYNGHGCIDQLFKYSMYLKNREYPKLIIKEINYLDFTEHLKISRWQYLFFLNNKDIFEYCDRNSIFDHINLLKIQPFRYSECADAIGDIFKYIYDGMPIKTYDTKGYRGVDTWNEPWMDYPIIEFDPNTPSTSKFKDFLADCQMNDIKVVLVFSPIYTDDKEPCINKEVWDQFVTELCNNYGCSYLDYHINIEGITDNKSNFYNANHLYGGAADMFSIIIANEIKDLNIYDR